MSHTSRETIARYQTKRGYRDALEAEAARAPEPKAKRSRVAPALMIAAELTLFAAGFAAGETIRVVSTEGPPACASCEVK